ncbi:MAG: hypothetical protein K5928_00470 [Prevotella sp.]|nr:hypothetical protein [Prevotella sp.]
MKQLNTIQTAVFILGAVLMAVGAGCSLLLPAAAPWLYATGALGFTSMQMLQRYEGKSFVVRRLRRLLLLSDLLFLVSAVLMVQQATGWPRLPYNIYVQYVHNNWVVTLLIAAILQLYATHRIDHELRREGEKI